MVCLFGVFLFFVGFFFFFFFLVFALYYTKWSSTKIIALENKAELRVKLLSATYLMLHWASVIYYKIEIFPSLPNNSSDV